MVLVGGWNGDVERNVQEQITMLFKDRIGRINKGKKERKEENSQRNEPNVKRARHYFLDEGSNEQKVRRPKLRPFM
jgi:hypothetical protein